MPDKRIRLDLTNINTRFSDGTPAARGVYYLKTSEMEVRDGLGLAISTLFSPVQAALDGCPLDEVERLINQAELVCHGYWSKARIIASANPIENCSVIAESTENLDDETFELD